MSKRIKGITIELDGSSTGLQKALEDVNKKSRDVSKELRDVEKLLKFSPGNAELVAQKQKLLADQVEATREKLTRLKDAQADVDKQFAEGKINEEQYRAFQREITETESKLKHFEGQLATSQSKLKEFGDSAIEAGEKMKKVGEKTTEVGKSLSTKVTAPLAGVGAIAAKVGSDFEASMSKVQAISGASGEDIALLTEKARQMGATTQFSASEAADALSFMAMAGWKTGDMLSGIEGIMALAAASGEDLALTSDIVTDALTAFGMTAADSGQFADVLAAASSNANTNVAMLGESFKYVAPVAGALKFSAEDTALALGLMANSGIKASNAGTALRSMMTNLTEVSKPVAKEMARLGLSLTDSEGNMKSFREIMDDLRETYRDMTPDMQANSAAQLFGKEAMSGALAIINASEKDYLSLAEAINTSEGAAQQMANTMMDNLQGRMKEMQSALEEAAISIYDNLQPALEGLVGFIQRLADWFNQLSPATQNTVVVLAGLAAALGPVLVIAGTLISSIGALFTAFGTISGAIAVVTTGAAAATPAVGALAAAFTFITGPIGIAIAAITAIIAVGVLLYKNWDEVSAFLLETWENIKSVASTVFSAIGEVLSSTWDSIKSKIDTVWNGIKSFFSTIWNGIKSVFDSIIKSIKTLLDKYWDSMGDGIKKVWDGIKQYFSAAWDLIKNVFVGALLVILQLLTGQWDEAKKSTEQIWNNIKKALSSMWDAIKKVFSGALDAVIGYVKTSWDNIKTTTSTVFDTVKRTISNVWTDIKTVFSNALRDILVAVAGRFTDMIQSVRGKMNDVLSAIKNVWDSVMSFFRGIDLYEMGKDIIQGLINGIKAMATKVVDSVKGVVDSAIEGAKNLLGIKSPSRVFMEIGDDTALGFIEGLRSMAGQVAKASDYMVGAAIPTLPNINAGSVTGGGRTASASNTNNVTHDYRGFMEGANFIVREEADIRKIARELHVLQKQSARRVF